jgi:hypothetical protein
LNKDILRQVATVFATAAMITVNVLANALPLNGQNSGEISDQFDVYFTPAGYVFSIWGLIYIAVILYSIYQALPAQQTNPTLRAIAPLYWLSSAANIVWLFLWHYNVFYPTILAMGVLLGSLIAIYLRLDVGRVQVSTGMKAFVHLTFSLYLGWITVATIANITVLLWLANWNGFGISAQSWTAVMLAVIVGIAGIATVTRNDTVYLLVLVWAMIGIAVKHPDVTLVAMSAITAASLVALLALFSLRAKAYPILNRASP